MGQTENVTVLFTGLAQSTEVAPPPTPEIADSLRRALFSELRRAVASSGGTEVKNLGDGIMVVFRSSSTALACAVDMQQGVDRRNRRDVATTGLRVGVSTGEATHEGDDYFGDPIVEAARLCAQAEGGQILTTEFVRMMAGRRVGHALRSLGEMELKGLPEPLEVLEVGWEPLVEDDAPSTRTPLPPRLAIAPSVGLIGRETQANLLSNGFKRVAAGDGREVVLISGDPGVGKSALAAHTARIAFDAGACALLGRCDEDLAVPYGPFVEALHHYVKSAPDEALASHVRNHGAELARIVPSLGQRLGELPDLQSSDPNTERYLLFERGAGDAGGDLEGPTARPRAGRPPLGGQAERAAAPAHRDERPGGSGARRGHVPPLGPLRGTPPHLRVGGAPAGARGGRDRSDRARRQRGRRLRRGGSRSRAPGAWPRACPHPVPGDRRQPVLRRRGPPSPVRDRGHRLRGRDGPMGAPEQFREHDDTRERPAGHRVEGDAAGGGRAEDPVLCVGYRAGVRPRPPGRRDGTLGGRAAGRPRRRRLQRTGAGDRRDAGALHVSPRPHPAHLVPGPRRHAHGRGCTATSRRRSRPDATAGPTAERWSSPTTGPRPHDLSR